MSGQRTQRTYRCRDKDGYEVLVTFALTNDRKMIAAKRSNSAEPIYMSPRVISRIIDGLRDLQAQALLGETWDV